MELQSIACNNCGAPLEVPAAANFVTCNHCNSQLAVKRNENVTYTEKLKEIDERTEDMQKELEQLRVDNELAKLERDWDREKETYMVRDKEGHKHIPTTTGSVVGGIVIVIFGIIWTAFAASMSRGFSSSSFGGGMGLVNCFPLFGIVFIILGIGVSIFSYSKAKDYLRAERGFRRRRSALMDKKYEQRDQGINIRP